MIFEQLLGDAVFCTAPLLLYRWERAAALVATDVQRARLATVADWLRERMEERLTDPAEIASIALQTQGAERYAGPLVAGRFQVMESFVRGTYYVVDHHRADLLVRVAGPVSDIKRFASKDDANAWISSFTTGVVEPKYQPSQQETEMPKKPVVVTDPLKPRGRPKNDTNGAAKERAPRKPGVGALTKELILKGWDNDKVIAELQKKFPEAANSASNVNFYRVQLRKSGELPTAR